MSEPVVILRHCPDYDPERIARIVGEGVEELGPSARIRGRVTIKPSVVFSHPKVAPSAHTRPEFMDGLLAALESKAAEGSRAGS